MKSGEKNVERYNVGASRFDCNLKKKKRERIWPPGSISGKELCCKLRHQYTDSFPLARFEALSHVPW